MKRITAAMYLMLVALTARAEVPDDYSVVLLTENFPPFNMAIDDKNFSRDEGIDGISADIVREMFKRAGINYSLSLRFPWDRLYNLTLEKPNYGLFSTTLTPEREPLFKWVGPLGSTSWVLVAMPDSKVTVNSLEEAAQYRIGAYKNNAVTQHLESKGVPLSIALRDQENAVKLSKGTLDLWATDDPAGRYMARQAGVAGLKIVMTFNKADLYLALNKDTPDEVVSRLQTALDELRKEGFVEQITSGYL